MDVSSAHLSEMESRIEIFISLWKKFRVVWTLRTQVTDLKRFKNLNFKINLYEEISL